MLFTWPNLSTSLKRSCMVSVWFYLISSIVLYLNLFIIAAKILFDLCVGNQVSKCEKSLLVLIGHHKGSNSLVTKDIWPCHLIGQGIYNV